MSEFWIKYILRVAHIGSIIGLCHKTLTDFNAQSISSNNAVLYSILGIIAALSGN